MVWSEYTNEPYEQVPMEDNIQDIHPPLEPLSFEDWVDWYEPHLSNMWRDFVAYRQDAGIYRIVGVDMDFWDYARFIYGLSDQNAIPIE